MPGGTAFLEHAHVPRALIHAELRGEQECPVAKLGGRRESLHVRAIGTAIRADEGVHPDGVPADCARVRPPTVIERERLIAGRHPCAMGSDSAWLEVRQLAEAGVTLFVDLTQQGELEPYSSLVEPPTRYVNRPIVDFSIPARDALVATLDEIDAELDAGGIVYVHCWAGCGRTGVVVGSWLVRHGASPEEALRVIAERRGLGCPQTLEQRMFVLDWIAGK